MKIPVTVGFDPKKIIGMLQIDEKVLPKVPNYHFALGGIKKDGTFEIKEISLIHDSNFKSWKRDIDFFENGVKLALKGGSK